MPRNINFQQISESRKLAQADPWIWLVDIQVPSDPIQRFRLTSHDEPVEFGESPDGDTLVYSPAPIAFDGIPESADGSLPSLSITLQDVLGIAATVVDQHDGLVGQPVVIQVISSAHIGLGAPAQRLDAQVSSATVTDDGPRVALSISAKNVYQTAFPSRTYTQTRFPGIKR